jgi:hypothetical protein
MFTKSLAESTESGLICKGILSVVILKKVMPGVHVVRCKGRDLPIHGPGGIDLNILDPIE